MSYVAPPWDAIFTPNDEILEPVQESLALLRKLRDNTRSLSALPIHSEITSPEYHVLVQFHVAYVSRILVQSVVSYNQGQPFIPALSFQNILQVSSSPVNSMTRGNP